MYYSDFINEGTYLAHHGIKGQKWGIRRYQNPDGSLTPEGKKRYGINDTSFVNESFNKREFKKEYKQKIKIYKHAAGKMRQDAHQLAREDADNRLKNDIDKANKNKSLIKDLINECTKYLKTDCDLDKIDGSYRYLIKKYPEHKNVLEGLAFHEHIDNAKDIEQLKRSKNPVGDLLNYDFYYEADYGKYDDAINKLNEQGYRELTQYFINKYGNDIAKF